MSLVVGRVSHALSLIGSVYPSAESMLGTFSVIFVFPLVRWWGSCEALLLSIEASVTAAAHLAPSAATSIRPLKLAVSSGWPVPFVNLYPSCPSLPPSACPPSARSAPSLPGNGPPALTAFLRTTSPKFSPRPPGRFSTTRCFLSSCTGASASARLRRHFCSSSSLCGRPP